VVGLLCGMLALGAVISAVVFGFLLGNFSRDNPGPLIQVVQGAAVFTLFVNSYAMWKQEPRNAERAKSTAKPPSLREAMAAYFGEGQSVRALLVVALGTVGFQMQDVLLEPYGGEILHLRVYMTTNLTAALFTGFGGGLLLAAWLLSRTREAYQVATLGVLAGLPAFACVTLAAPLYSAVLFGSGVVLIGFGSAMFMAGTLSAAMGKAKDGATGLALGSWGAVQVLAVGSAIIFAAAVKTVVSELAGLGLFGPALARPVTGYAAVYLLEIVLLLATLIAIFPLLRRSGGTASSSSLRPA